MANPTDAVKDHLSTQFRRIQFLLLPEVQGRILPNPGWSRLLFPLLFEQWFFGWVYSVHMRMGGASAGQATNLWMPTWLCRPKAMVLTTANPSSSLAVPIPKSGIPMETACLPTRTAHDVRFRWRIFYSCDRDL
jgi:hypothetical protein